MPCKWHCGLNFQRMWLNKLIFRHKRPKFDFYHQKHWKQNIIDRTEQWGRFGKGKFNFFVSALWRWQWVLHRMTHTCSALLIRKLQGNPSLVSWLQVTHGWAELLYSHPTASSYWSFPSLNLAYLETARKAWQYTALNLQYLYILFKYPYL